MPTSSLPKRRVPVLKTDNPWYHLDRSRVFDYSLRSEMHHELILTNGSYSGHTDYDDTYVCPCGGRFWFRPTVGARQCASCRDLLVSGMPTSISKIEDPVEKSRRQRAWIQRDCEDAASRTTDQEELEKLRKIWKDATNPNAEI